jgi:hypothetical protein
VEFAFAQYGERAGDADQDHVERAEQLVVPRQVAGSDDRLGDEVEAVGGQLAEAGQVGADEAVEQAGDAAPQPELGLDCATEIIQGLVEHRGRQGLVQGCGEGGLAGGGCAVQEDDAAHRGRVRGGEMGCPRVLW